MSRARGSTNLIAAVKRAITRSGLSLNELSRRCGVSRPQLSRFLSGQRTLTFENAVLLMDSLGFRFLEPEGPEAASAPKTKGKRKT